MTRARDMVVAARRLLVLAGAVAGLWLVSWLTAGHASAAGSGGTGDPVGELVGALLPGGEPVTHGVAREPRTVGSRAPVARAGDVVSPVARAVAPLVRGAGAVVAPVAGTAAPGSPGPVARARGAALPKAAAGLVSPVARAAAPVVRSAGAVVAPVADTAARVVAPVARAAVPVVRGVAAPVADAAAGVVSPVVRSVGTVVSPLADAAAPVVSPVLRAVAPVVEPVSQLLCSTVPALKPVTDLLTPLTTALQPILGTTVPVSDPLAPVAGGVARPSVVPGYGAVGPVAGSPPSLRIWKSWQSAAAHLWRKSGQNRTEPQPQAPPQTHQAYLTRTEPGRAPAPAPVSDVACGVGSAAPLAFLVPGRGPGDLPAVLAPSGTFVPLWRPCEPGTGPG
ncbi:hypothetical protein ABJI51_33680 [Amycolatopsis sp. NEAU-NG30]|uniref:Uncharacterized protein n=1 Tax=Amycolatopsis melonis TaxID=3156488 RepID=A0ABV0LP40_9PSEU